MQQLDFEAGLKKIGDGGETEVLKEITKYQYMKTFIPIYGNELTKKE